jgi:serine/threonine-protein kinase
MLDASHPPPERLRAFASGRLGDEELGAISSHLDACPACRSLVDGFFAEDPLLGQLQAAAPPAGSVPEDEEQRRRAARALRRTLSRARDSSGHPPPSAGPGGEGAAPPPGLDGTAARPGPTPGPESSKGGEPDGPAPPRQVGEYDLLSEAGRGGMGVVYKARHRRLHRLAAVKMLLSGPFASPKQKQRFRLEAELAARVRHPNVVQVYEAGTHDGQPYLAMEWVEGGTLAERLCGAPWPPAQVAPLVEAVARGVHAAHRQGVIHRDLKPGNVLLAACGFAGAKPQAATPKIADFSLARTLQAEPDLTGAGLVVGTPEYMAPEQAAGDGTRVGPAVDIYALGVVLYELLTGRPPFWGGSATEVLRASSLAEPARPRCVEPRVPRDLEAIALKCLRKEPARRYASAEELAEDLRRYREGRPVAARPPRAAARAARRGRRPLRPASLLAALAALVVTAFLLVTWR